MHSSAGALERVLIMKIIQTYQKPVWILFFLSGVCALIYEVIWTHELSLILGNTVYSLSAVLTAFMGGLALGSYLAGRFAHKMIQPLKLYGLLEMIIGIYCALLPLFFDGADIVYKVIYNHFGTSFFLLSVTRFFISFILLLIPTTLMGATLPILTEALLIRKQELGFTSGALYAVNTFGAAAGGLIAGFLLIPALGILSTTLTAAAANLILGISAILLNNKLQRVKIPRKKTKAAQKSTSGANPSKENNIPIPGNVVAIAVIVFGISGFAAMVSQVGWTRVLSLAIGSTIYAFSIIVATFILGLAAGSAIAARIADKRDNLILTLAFVQLGTGVLCSILLPILGWSPLFFVKLILKYTESFGILLLIEFSAIALLILLPTLLMGATFPLVAKIYQARQQRAGKTIGDIYAVNTIGAILGAFLAGFVLIPQVGIQNSLLLAAILFSLSGIVLFFLSQAKAIFRQVFVAVLLVIVGFGSSFTLTKTSESWNPAILSSGLYLLSHETELEQISKKGTLADVLLQQKNTVKYYKEGLTATVAVMEQNGERFLKIGGKTDATTFSDMPTQLLLAHVPMLLQGNPQNALVIGLGGGTTAGAALTYPSLKKLDVVEISPEVIEAVRDKNLFDAVNEQPFKDERQRLNLIVTDARNHVALTAEKYDVIISEPSNPWLAGVASLFTKEHLENCRQRLNPGGIICQWLPAYRMSREDFLSVLATFASVFKQVTVWESIPGVDYLFIGSLQPQTIDYQRFTEAISIVPVRKNLSRLLIGDLPSFASYFLADQKQVRALTQNSPINTDDNLRLQYSAPRNIFQHSARTIPFNKIRGKSRLSIRNMKLPEEDRQKLSAQIKQARIGRAWTLQAIQHRWQGELKPTLQALGKALQTNPADWNGKELEIKMRLDAVKNSLQTGKFEEALARLQKIQLLPGQSDAQLNEYKKIAYERRK